MEIPIDHNSWFVKAVTSLRSVGFIKVFVKIFLNIVGIFRRNWLAQVAEHWLSLCRTVGLFFLWDFGCSFFSYFLVSTIAKSNHQKPGAELAFEKDALRHFGFSESDHVH